MKTKIKSVKSKLAKTFFATVLLISLATTQAKATLQQNVTGPGGTTVDNSNAPDGFAANAFQLPDAAITDGLGTIDTANGVLQFEGVPFLFQGPLTNVSFDANAAGNSLVNIEVADFATVLANAGRVISFNQTGAPTLVGPGAQGQVLVYDANGQLTVGNIAGGGGGTVTQITSNDASITVANPTTTPNLSVAASQPNITSIGTTGTPVAFPSSVSVTENSSFLGDLTVSGTAFLNIANAGAGTAANPSVNFSGDLDTGLSSANPDELIISAGGLGIVTINTLGESVAGNLNVTGNITGGTLSGNLNSTNVNITGGTITGTDIAGASIENSAIGTVSPSTGTFTILNTSGDTTLGEDLTVALTATVAGVRVGAGAGVDSTLLGGNGANASGQQSLAIGDNAQASAERSIAVGAASSSTGLDSIAIGVADATAEDAIAIGFNASATAEDTIAFGMGSIADTAGSIAIGMNANTAGFQNVSAIGNGATATTDNQIVLGSDGTNGNPPAPDVLINGNLRVNGTITAAQGQQTFNGPVTFNDPNNMNNVTIINNNGVLTFTGDNGGMLDLNVSVLDQVQFVIDPNGQNNLATINYGPDARKIQFTSFAPSPLVIDLVNNRVQLGFGPAVDLVDGTPVDLTKANLRLTLNDAANSIDIAYINNTGFDAIPREFLADVSGVVR